MNCDLRITYRNRNTIHCQSFYDNNLVDTILRNNEGFENLEFRENAKIHVMYYDRVMLETIIPLFKPNTKLLIHSHFDTHFPNIVFTNVTSLRLILSYENTIDLVAFLNNNPNLKKLELDSFDFGDNNCQLMNRDILRTIQFSELKRVIINEEIIMDDSLLCEKYSCMIRHGSNTKSARK